MDGSESLNPRTAAEGVANGHGLPTVRRAADPLALKLLATVSKGTVEEQEYIFRTTARVLGIALDEARADVLEAVSACREKLRLTMTPSRSQYREWVKREPVWAAWPTDSAAVQAFGGRWTDLRAAIDGNPVADLRALGLSRRGPAVEDEALLDAIRRWHEERPDPQFRFDRFRKWATEQLRTPSDIAESWSADGDGLELRLAVSPNTYITRFGSWLEALAKSGVLAGVSFDTYRRLVGAAKDYSDERLKQTLRDAAEWADDEYGRPLTRALLDRFRRRELRHNWDDGTFTPVPAGSTMVSRFGSLPEAMLAAGIIDAGEAARRVTQRGRKLSLATLAAHVRVCAMEYGLSDVTELSDRTYRRWRDALAERLAEPVPASITIRDRMGTPYWRDAMRLAAATRVDADEVAALAKKYAAVAP